MTKPYDIPKALVWEAYLSVKANGGSAGTDQESLGQFEGKLSNNLYKLWNRLCSGSYFPPPVKGVPIPKKSAGVRMLGVPTVADRVAQTVVRRLLEPAIDPLFHANSTVIVPGAQPMMRLPWSGSEAGNMTGWLSSISRVCLTRSTTSY